MEKLLLILVSGIFIVLSSDFMLWDWQILSSQQAYILVDSRKTDNKQMAKEINKIILFGSIKLGYMTTCVGVCVCVYTLLLWVFK